MKVQQQTEERVAAAVLLTGYIAELLPAVLESLKMSGYLLDEIKAGKLIRKTSFPEFINHSVSLTFLYSSTVS